MIMKKKLVLAGMTVLLSVSMSACGANENPEAYPQGDPGAQQNTNTNTGTGTGTGSTQDPCPIKVPGRVFKDGGPAKYDWQGENGRLHVPDPDAYAQPEAQGPGYYWTGCNRDPVKGARWTGGPYKDTQEMANEFMRVFGSTCTPNPGGPYKKKSDEYNCEGYDWSARIGVMRPGHSPEEVAMNSELILDVTGENWFIQAPKKASGKYIERKLAEAS